MMEVARRHGPVAETIDEVAPLETWLAFFTSGHQATRSSIPCKSIFVLTSTVSCPLSPLLVVLSTFGPAMLAAPLLGIRTAAHS